MIPKLRTRGIGERNRTANPETVVKPEISNAEPVLTIVVSIAWLSVLCSLSSRYLSTI